MKSQTLLQTAGLAALPLVLASPTADKGVAGRYRISPFDGSKIALPSKKQLEFQDKEIGMLIHFEMATYIKNQTLDGCNNVPELVPNIDLFDPELLNTDQWMDSAKALGAKYATLVAKHNCGLTTWPSKVKFEDGQGEEVSYNYTIAQSPVHGKDVVGSFVKSASKYDMGHGFYYSSVVNNFLNVQMSEVRNGSLAPGQVSITNDTYTDIVLAQLNELWSEYGTLTEIWFDGGYSSEQKDSIEKLLGKTQPQAVIFNGCQADGTCLSPNPIRWIGTETGHAPEENWSTGLSNDGGDPDSPYFAPAECDTTLQTDDRWFYGVEKPLRNISELISVYHDSVGRNCVLAMDLSPDRSGLIPANHAARYKQLGDFIKSCYAEGIPHEKMSSSKGNYKLGFRNPTSIDRIVLMEDQSRGQVIRSYSVYAKIVPDNAEDDNNLSWTLVSKGNSVGHKRIGLFEKPVTVREIMVNATSVDTPQWRSVSVHLCDELEAKAAKRS